MLIEEFKKRFAPRMLSKDNLKIWEDTAKLMIKSDLSRINLFPHVKDVSMPRQIFEKRLATLRQFILNSNAELQRLDTLFDSPALDEIYYRRFYKLEFAVAGWDTIPVHIEYDEVWQTLIDEICKLQLRCYNLIMKIKSITMLEVI